MSKQRSSGTSRADSVLRPASLPKGLRDGGERQRESLAPSSHTVAGCRQDAARQRSCSSQSRGSIHRREARLTSTDWWRATRDRSQLCSRRGTRCCSRRWSSMAVATSWSSRWRCPCSKRSRSHSPRIASSIKIATAGCSRRSGSGMREARTLGGARRGFERRHQGVLGPRLHRQAGGPRATESARHTDETLALYSSETERADFVRVGLLLRPRKHLRLTSVILVGLNLSTVGVSLVMPHDELFVERLARYGSGGVGGDGSPRALADGVGNATSGQNACLAGREHHRAVARGHGDAAHLQAT